MTQKWIGPFYDEQLPQVGYIGFLVRISNQIKGWERHELRDTPAYTNESRQPKLNGWCGSWNDTSTHGCGLAKVVRVAKNGRVLVQEVDKDSDEGQATLEELGYPGL